MPDPTKDVAKSRRARMLRVVGGFALAYGIAFGASRARMPFEEWLFAEFGDQEWMLTSVWTLYRLVMEFIKASYGTTLVLASLLALFGLLVRNLSRSRIRAGLADPLERVRAFVARHTRLVGGLVVAPAVAWSVLIPFAILSLFHSDGAGRPIDFWTVVVGCVLPTVATFIAQVALARRGLRALLAPTMDVVDAKDVETQAEGFVFDAVAVTLETRAAVAAMATFPIGFLLLALSNTEGRAPAHADLPIIAVYIAATAAGAALFCRASRIAVGVDGVLVKGTSRKRFFAYRDVDGARARGADIELHRGTHVVLRLQLHGKDAVRRQALLARIEAAIARAHAEREDPVASFVGSASSAELACAAGGGGDYRRPAVSRDQLWALLEGPAIDTASRRAAAEALARTPDTTERARLRVVAEHCAEPAVRLRIEELLEIDTDEAAVEGTRALERARSIAHTG